MKFLSLFFCFVFCSSIVFGFNCTTLEENLIDDCEGLVGINESLIANLIYVYPFSPNHSLIDDYNNGLVVLSPPNNTLTYDSGSIVAAWVEILSITPSVWFEETLYVPQSLVLEAEYDYSIVLPPNYYNGDEVEGEICRSTYSLEEESNTFSWSADDFIIGTEKKLTRSIIGYDTLTAQLEVVSEIKNDVSIWEEQCCRYGGGRCLKYCFVCEHDHTTYIEDTLTINDSLAVEQYSSPQLPSFIIFANYSDTYKGKIEGNNETNVLVDFTYGFYEEQDFLYSAFFSHQPYYFLNLQAKRRETNSSEHVILGNNSIYFDINNNCTIFSSDFFTTTSSSCIYSITNITVNPVEIVEPTGNYGILALLAGFFLAAFILYKFFRCIWPKKVIPILFLFLLFPNLALADDCGLTNLASCLPEKMYEYLIDLLNQPLEPLLDFVKSLLEAAPSIDLFISLWTIIIYIISFFYAVLFYYIGFQFLFSGDNPALRENAKQWLKNTLMLIVLVQASYFLYELVVEIASLLTTGILSLVDPLFFLITADNIINIGLEFLFVTFYAFTLFITLCLLVIRYLLVAFGVIFVPIGIFCYFVPPLRSFGSFINTLLLINIFVNVFDALIILGSSLLIEIPLFENIKILVMIACFSLINVLFVILALFVIGKSASSLGATNLLSVSKYLFPR